MEKKTVHDFEEQNLGMEPEDTERPGWQFAGWYIDPECTKRINPGAKIPDLTTLYPKWVPIVYPVLYELEEGKNSPYNPEAISAVSGIVKLYPAQCPGRQFAGWYWKGQKVEYLPEGLTEPVKLKAVFRDPVRIHFMTGKGSRIDAVQCSEKGILEKAPVPMRIGYTFLGWFFDPEGKRPWHPDDVFEEDTLLYAGWSLTEFPIVLDLAGGQLMEPFPSSYSVAAPSILLPNPIRPGYRFGGWVNGRGQKTLLIRRGTIGAQQFRAVWIEETPEIFVV